MVHQDLELVQRPSDDLKREIIHRLWHQSEKLIELSEYAEYFDYHWQSCQNMHLGARSKADILAARTHGEILNIIDVLWYFQNSGFQVTRVTLRTALKQKCFQEDSDERINVSIDLALRLWLTLNIRDASPVSTDRGIVWNDVSHLSTFVSEQFQGPTSDEPRAKEVLGSDMTAVKLGKINGISVKWVSNIKDHLFYNADRGIVKVYNLEHVLRAHSRSEAKIMPEQVIKETILTLHLLFPRWDQRTTKYLKKIGRSSFPEVYVTVPQQLYLTDFHYWQDRLAILLRASQAPPAAHRNTLPTLRFLWNDRRNPHQWWTFWFAASILLLTVVFGLISSVATCMQTMYTYQSLQLTRESIQLARDTVSSHAA